VDVSRSVIRYALLGGIITGATIGLPVLDLLNCACCAGIILGGFLSVFFATKDEGPAGVGVSKTDALQLGVLSGVFGALFGSFLHAVVYLLAGNVAWELAGSVLSDPDISGSIPPVLREALEESLSKQDGFSLLESLSHLMLWLVVAPLFGLLGGLLGYALLKRNPPPSPLSPSLQGPTRE